MGTRFWLARVAAMTLLFSAHAAWAIGDCENLQTKYSLTEVAVDAGLLAFSVSVDTCEESERPPAKEKLGPLQAVLVTDLALRNRRWFLSPKGPAQLEQVPAAAKKSSPLSAWPAFQREHGFRPIASATLATGGGACAVETIALLRGSQTTPIADAHGKDSFSTFRTAVRLHLGEGKTETLELARHAVSAGIPGVWVLPLAKSLRVYTVTARCAGGPPPGMFDADGDCYAVWSLGYKDLPTEKVPDLGRCLLAPPTPAPVPKAPADSSGKSG